MGIYFGHQSVGQDILQGLQELPGQESSLELQIKSLDEPVAGDQPVLYHSRIGRNAEPRAKMQAFAKILRSELGAGLDAAFFKFCYLDISPDTDVDKLFKDYVQSMEGLKQEFPDVVFGHVTVPLTSRQSGIKAWIKKLLGRPVRGYADNAARSRFNDLLRQEYQGQEPVFDVAKAESTYPDGSRCVFEHQGRQVFCLVPEYTHDGGHLNEQGKQVLAREFLLFLQSLSH